MMCKEFVEEKTFARRGDHEGVLGILKSKIIQIKNIELYIGRYPTRVKIF